MRAAAVAIAVWLGLTGAVRGAEAPIPAPPPAPPTTEDDAPAQARAAVADVLAFMLGRPSRIAVPEAPAAEPEALDAALAELALARVIAEVHGLADIRLALAAFDAVAAVAPLTARRVFDPASVLAGSHRALPALNAAIDRIEGAVPGYRNAATFRRFAADPEARRADELALPALGAVAVSLAVAAGPFALLAAVERCGQPGEAPPPRALVAALSLAAPDLYGFYRRSFADPAAAPDSAAGEAFIRNLRGAALRCAR